MKIIYNNTIYKKLIFFINITKLILGLIIKINLKYIKI